MRVRSVLSEAWRNFASGTSRGFLLALTLTLIVTVLAAADLQSVSKIVQQTNTFRQTGGSVQIVSAPKGIDARLCEALNDRLNIRSAGALRKGDSLKALNMPNNTLTAWEGTGSLIKLVAPHSTTASRAQGIWVAQDQAEVLSLRVGSTITTTTGTGTVSGIYPYPDDGRGRTLGYSTVSLVPATGEFDQCWAEIWPNDDPSGALLLTTVMSHVNTQDVKVEQFNGRLGQEFNPVTLIEERITKYVPYVTLVIGLAVGFAAIRLRKLELAAALHAQVRKAHLAWQVTIETILWLVPAILLSSALLLVFAHFQSLALPVELWYLSLTPILVSACGVLLGALAATALTREKHLFVYFKER